MFFAVFVCLLLSSVILCEDLPVITTYPESCPPLPNLQQTFRMSDMTREWQDYKHTANVPYTCASYRHDDYGTYSLRTEFKAIMDNNLYKTTIFWKMSNCTHTRAAGICADVTDGYVDMGTFRFLHISDELYVAYHCDDQGKETINVAATSRDYDQDLLADLLERNDLTRLSLPDMFPNTCPASLNCFAD